MKLFTFPLFMLLICALGLACTQEQSRQEAVSQPGTASIAEQDSIATAAKPPAQGKGSFAELRKMVSEAPFSRISPSLMGKDISVYLEHDSVADDAVMLYIGELEDATPQAYKAIIGEVIEKGEDEDALRPFHFHLLNYVMLQADGALAESIGQTITDFVGQYPVAFAAYMRQPGYKGGADLLKEYLMFIDFELNLQGNREQAFEEFSKKVKANSATASEKEQQFLTLFLKSLKERG